MPHFHPLPLRGWGCRLRLDPGAVWDLVRFLQGGVGCCLTRAEITAPPLYCSTILPFHCCTTLLGYSSTTLLLCAPGTLKEYSQWKNKNVQYSRLVSTRKAHLSIRTSHTNHIMNSWVVKKHTSHTGRVIYSRVVVDLCIQYQSHKYWNVLSSHYDTSSSSQGPCGSNVCTGWQRLVHTLDYLYDSYELMTCNGALSKSVRKKSINVSDDMHGSTTTCEFIIRFVRLVQMDKWALRESTSRQYWTTLMENYSFNYSFNFVSREKHVCRAASRGGGGGVLPYICYTGMCRWIGYGFQASLS